MLQDRSSHGFRPLKLVGFCSFVVLCTWVSSGTWAQPDLGKKEIWPDDHPKNLKSKEGEKKETDLSEPAAPTSNSAATATKLSLADCLHYAHERQPTLRALRASVASAQIGLKGFEEVRRNGGRLLPDLKFRQEQAQNGLRASEAELAQAEHEVSYAVIRTYYTVVYAREQAKVTADLVEQLDFYLKQVRKIVNSKGGGTKGISKDTENKLEILVGEARSKKIEAEFGIERARAALREAMGFPLDTAIDVRDEMLPEIEAKGITRDVIVSHALSRRGELTLAAIGADVTRLEICAQWSRKFLIHVPTFAKGSDVHSRAIPQAMITETEYRPGGIGLDVPGALLGLQKTRTARATQIHERANAVYEKVQGLIGLEAENGFLRYAESSKLMVERKVMSRAGKELVERQREASGGNFTKEDTLLNEVAATRAQAAFNETLYQQILHLAALERITAGGIRVNFPGR